MRHVGDPIVAIIAETLEQAKDAAELVKLDLEELPAVVNMPRAIQGGGAAVHDEAPDNICYDWELGDKAATDAAFARAAHVTKLDLINNRLVPNAMEPRAAIGQYDLATGDYTLYTTSQNPHVIRLLMGAFVLGMPEHKLRVYAPDVGGGFGSKIFHYAEEALVTWASARVGRPIKWAAERTESFMSRRPRPRPRHPRRDGDRRGRQVPRAARPKRSPTWAPICQPSRPAFRPGCTARCWPASTRRRRSTAR